MLKRLRTLAISHSPNEILKGRAKLTMKQNVEVNIVRRGK
jgi:hypothetical protein